MMLSKRCHPIAQVHLKHIYIYHLHHLHLLTTILYIYIYTDNDLHIIYIYVGGQLSQARETGICPVREARFGTSFRKKWALNGL